MLNEYPPFLSRNQLNFQEATSFAISIRSIAAAAGTVAIRGFTKEGMFVFSHTPNSNKTEKIDTFFLPDAPIMLTIDDETKSFAQGECFIRATLVLNKTSIYQLAAGFVAGKHGLCWPAVNAEEAELTKGKITTVVSADPTSNTELSLTVPAGETWKVRALRFEFVTTSIATSRRVHVVFTVNGAKVFETFSATDQIISQDKIYSCFPGADMTAPTNDNDILIPIPDNLILPPAAVITTETVNFNADDDFGAMTALIERSVIENV